MLNKVWGVYPPYVRRRSRYLNFALEGPGAVASGPVYNIRVPRNPGFSKVLQRKRRESHIPSNHPHDWNILSHLNDK